MALIGHHTSGQGWSSCGELADCELDGSEFLKVYAQYNDTSISTTILALVQPY